MSLPVILRDAARNLASQIFSNRALKVAVAPTPPDEVTQAEAQQRKPFTSLFLAAGGSRSMNVDGSVSPQRFSVRAIDTEIRTLTSIRLVVHDGNFDPGAGGNLRRYGSATAANTPLANGILLQSEQEGIVTSLFADPITTLATYFRNVDNEGDYLSFPAGIAPGTDLFIIVFRLPTPIVLFPGTRDRIDVVIQDDLTPQALFEAQASGWVELVGA